MSSSEPVGTRALGTALAEHGLSLIDAPVSGGAAKAQDGTLAVMIGADGEAAAAARRTDPAMPWATGCSAPARWAPAMRRKR